jgi:hypothetical protein
MDKHFIEKAAAFINLNGDTLAPQSQSPVAMCHHFAAAVALGCLRQR